MKQQKFNKTVIINRAVPGSGKSSISRAITSTLEHEGLSIAVHSTDEYFMHDGRYIFDIRKLHHFHQLNLADFERSLRNGVDVVICDNTNLQPWQTQPYTDCARKFGYKVIFLNLPPRNIWKHLQAQLVTAAKPDAHQVPLQTLADFIRDFNDYNDLLDPDSAVNSAKQHHFVWSSRLNRPEAVGNAAHFDRDAVVTVLPEEFHQAKLTIGETFLNLIRK